MDSPVKINVYFNKESTGTYESLMKRKIEKEEAGKATSWATVIEDLLIENELLKVRVEDRQYQEKLIMDQLTQILTPIRIRTGYTDKNTRILLELMNGLLFKYNITKLIDTGLTVTEPVKEATKKVTDDISDLVKRNLEKKNQRMTPPHE